jgi:hypothetical protein
VQSTVVRFSFFFVKWVCQNNWIRMRLMLFSSEIRTAPRCGRKSALRRSFAFQVPWRSPSRTIGSHMIRTESRNAAALRRDMANQRQSFLAAQIHWDNNDGPFHCLPHSFHQPSQFSAILFGIMKFSKLVRSNNSDSGRIEQTPPNFRITIQLTHIRVTRHDYTNDQAIRGPGW